MTTPKPTNTHQEAATHSDPLGAYPQQFQKHLESQHYMPATIAQYGRCINVLRSQMVVLGVKLHDLDEDWAVELIGKSPYRSFRSKTSAFIIRTFVRFLATLGATKTVLATSPGDSARGQLKQDYENYLRRQRGLSERTIFHSWRIADRFLEFRFGKEIGDLSQITAADIASFLQQLTTRKPPLRDKTLSSHLRNFFRYLFQAGKTPTNLALGILSVAQRYGARLPRHLTAEQVDTLVKAVRTDTVVGRRNYAMMLLVARLGLRAPEVVAMQIDDIDWRSGEIVIRGKGKRHDRVPLPPDVGEALADYIRFARVTASRVLFVTERSPHRPFKSGQVLNYILRDAFAKSGLTPPAPYVGSHILRHSLATNLVQRGASLEEISDVLRHRSRASTMIYAKLDIDGLRSIALPWPAVGGVK
ncbi:MAG TPA: site-specific integrase [Pirellulales bacterium]|jgi:site-specific recombinase XerD|nr:site-specific integrase [Pirellulales bacterium]